MLSLAKCIMITDEGRLGGSEQQLVKAAADAKEIYHAAAKELENIEKVRRVCGPLTGDARLCSPVVRALITPSTCAISAGKSSGTRSR